MKNNKRILVISDSLALPRSKPEETLYEETYPYLLRRDFEVLQISFGGGTIKEIVHQAHYYVSFNPDIVVLQSGIVDCAFRAFPVSIDKGSIYSKTINLYKRIVAHIISPRSLRRYLRIRYTKPTDFLTSLNELTEMFDGSVVIGVGIVPASKEYETIIPGIADSISEYNSMIESVVGTNNFISLYDMSKEGIMSDFHHINSIGHKYIYNRILEVIKSH